ncbi:Type 1 glutamine amidotransferase-like domain-containing protein [Candidatus Parcubacteria bacterium]|nr:Type 1 glutamine amidotransferase-like domain-containing protein [Candidatus Parcubacteria bacterium]
MKLLLTSAGITNNTIKEELAALCNKKFSECTAIFVPTAANTEAGDKSWLIDNFREFQNLGLKELDIVDISALPREDILARFKSADILIFGGGNTFHLMHSLEKLGLKQEMQELLNTRVYFGISAGSMVSTANLILSDSNRLYSEYTGPVDRIDGLGLVDFHIRPHFNSPHFPDVNSGNLKKIAKDFKEPIYAIDDNTAIMVKDGNIKIVSEGKWEKFN